jgi:hypothetical protein
MSVRRYYKDREPGTLKAAEAALIAACGGPVAAAGKCSVGKTVLQQASDGDHPTRHLSLPVVAQLERACGKPIVTTFLAAEQGFVLEKLGPVNLAELPVIIGRITTEMGELLSAAALDMRSGQLSRANAAIVRRETDDVIAALLILRAGAGKVMGEP